MSGCSRAGKRKKPDAANLFKALRSGDNTALSTAITLVESSRSSDQEVARALIQKCLPLAGRSIRIGITGVPGVGKSSFIEAFGKQVIGQRE